ncbi:hypothetical protein ASPZODRAFT_155391 [Penicilliopsis zonata CBS 506.65]|uniref:Cytochrome P450 monooxygenase n=1 Tax=Penicilliopsis zonata CBS 506.65 TaxID=1073090 RepID=A0A1L9S556_9EURO|nr:hypothetical protein ASPZODRAFT_155391 [Penicilliopsis zonata CBS 506.65]OJJ42281.1 hypothetical protein ASPZODRAFT_155391 [Penicilliopsis zonata CBS 506.65]
MAGWIMIILVTLALPRPLYRIFFHPLRGYPGPLLTAVSSIPYVYWTITGVLHARIRELHDLYGPVVRLRPNALTYRTPEAWTDIYGYRKHGALPFSKDPEFFTPTAPGSSHMVNASEADHARQKKLLAHAFSDRSLREQEALIVGYIDLFIERLQEYADSRQDVNIEKWLNFLTFDIIGDLAFGEPFGCLQGSEYHPWVATVFQSIKTGACMRAMAIYPPLLKVFCTFMPSSFTQKRVAHYQMSKDKVSRRLATETARPDIISYIQRYNEDDERGMLRAEIETNAAIIIQAGSETTATALAACLFYLLKHPVWLARVREEVRGSFKDGESITFSAVSVLPGVNAVIEESLRLFPPAPAIGPRVVPAGGAMVDGGFVPGGISVSVAHYSAFRAASNFIEPDSFRPERWLEHKGRFSGDRREALQPFSYGPRACIGRNLAYAEMRTILAKILWNFDVELQPQSASWDDCKSYIVWEKGPLWVCLNKSV